MAIERPEWDKTNRGYLDDSLKAQVAFAEHGIVKGFGADDVRAFFYGRLLGDPKGQMVGGSWAPRIQTPAKVSYTFEIPTDPNYSPEAKTASPFTDLQRNAALEAMWQIEQVCGLTFALAGDGNATIRFGNHESGLPQAYPPVGCHAAGSPGTEPRSSQGDVWINKAASLVDPIHLHPWGRDFTTILHELGHAVGLSHSFPGTNFDDDHALNSRECTVMALRGSNAPTYMVGDILALRQLYGVP